MQTAWSILALALFLTDGSPKDQPEPASSHLKITFKFCNLSEPAELNTTLETPEPDTCSKPDDEKLPCREPWQLSLPEATRIALQNGLFIRVLSDSNPGCLRVSRMSYSPDEISGCLSAQVFDALDDPGVLKAHTMALVRSVEEQYWNLYAARAHLENAEAALGLAGQRMSEYTIDLESQASSLAVADAADGLEQLSTDVDRASSAVIDAEKHLRMIMGLSNSDSRAIVPTSNPVTAWIVAGAKSASKKETHGNTKHHETAVLGLKFYGPPASLAESVQKVTGDYTSYTRAKKAARADARRLAHLTRAFSKSRVTAGGFLDFVRQYAASLTAQSACLAAYNTSLAALGEASGTLLEMRDIVIADEPERAEPSQVASAKKDDQARTTALETARLAVAEVPPIPVLPELEPYSEDQARGTKPVDQDDKEVVFSFSLGGLKCEVSIAKP